MVDVKRIEWKDWQCLHISDEGLELIVSLEFGPRILFCSYPGGENMFYEEDFSVFPPAKDTWHHYGGHRLWHGPQVGNRPNEPDNDLLSWQITECGVVLCAKPEPRSHIQKEISIELVNGKATISHFLTNTGVWDVSLTVWAISQMAPGGMAVLPLPRNPSRYLPTYAIACWPFTKLDDPRVRFQDGQILVRHDCDDDRMFKIGYANLNGEAWYEKGGMRFIKSFVHQKDAEYSDFGSSCECYMDRRFLELESLSPYCRLAPNDTARHVETWRIERLPSYNRKNVLF